MRMIVSFTQVKLTDDTVYITDDDKPGATSVTNAAEQVVEILYATHGDRRIMYRDTDGEWGELKHKGGEFTGYGKGSPPDTVH